MPTKNLVAFFVLSTITIIGWWLLESWIFPRPERKKPVATAETWPWAGQPKDVQRVVVTQLSAAGMANGLGSDPVFSLATAAALLHTHPPLFEKKVEKPPIVEKPPTPVAKVPDIPFGDDSFNLRVRLSPLGASVREVVLTQFKAANEFGLPMFQGGNRDTPLPLHLVPDARITAMRDNEITYDDLSPFYHYTLYHYEKPDDAYPVDTLGKIAWKVVEQPTDPTADPQRAVFEAEVPGQNVVVTKTFTLGKGDYHIGLSVKVRPKSGAGSEKFRYQLMGARGLPIEGIWYTYTFRNAMIGAIDKRGSAFRDLEEIRQIMHWEGGELHPRADKVIRYAGVAVQYFASVVAVDKEQNPGVQDNFIERARATLESSAIVGRIKGIERSVLLLDSAGKEQPFEIAPNSQARAKLYDRRPGSEVIVVWTGVGDRKIATDLLDPATNFPLLFDDVSVRLMTEPISLEAGEVEHKYTLYNGPVKVRLLGQLTGAREVRPELVDFYEHTLALNTLTDYASPGWMGSFASSIYLTPIIIFFTNLIHGLIFYIHKIIPWYGLCIIGVTVIVRGCMFPISRKQAKTSMDMQEKMGKLAPEVKKLQEKYKDDMAALNQARTELYLRHGINPLSTMGGCLLLFAQMPIFLGLYYALQESIHFRLDAFLWMPNLAAPDMLSRFLGPQEWIPFLSRPQDMGGFIYLGPFFNLLPIIAVALMIVQQKMMTPPPQDEQQEMQQKMMKYMMVVFGLMFYKVAAGLCIYFIASSLWGLTERKLLPKKKAAQAGGELAATPPPPFSSAKGGGKPVKDGKAESNGGVFQRLKDRWEEVLKSAGKQGQARRDEGGRKRKKKKDGDRGS